MDDPGPIVMDPDPDWVKVPGVPSLVPRVALNPDGTVPGRHPPAWTPEDAARIRQQPRTLQLYALDIDTWNSYWLVMARSPDAALRLIKRHIRQEGHEWERKRWRGVTLDTLPEGYFMRVLAPGEVWAGSHD